MSARRLWVLVHNLPPDSLTANIASGQARRPEEPQGNVTYLEDIPKVGLREAQQFVNSKPEEFFSKVGAS